mmetsp:Transcript_44866/g.119451  ORF Transcript_44866/g.119451 Transcript_44866/m.119451 type:complete len:134 (+) Transcript_44866:53-454(+)
MRPTQAKQQKQFCQQFELNAAEVKKPITDPRPRQTRAQNDGNAEGSWKEDDCCHYNRSRALPMQKSSKRPFESGLKVAEFEAAKVQEYGPDAGAHQQHHHLQGTDHEIPAKSQPHQQFLRKQSIPHELVACHQ